MRSRQKQMRRTGYLVRTVLCALLTGLSANLRADESTVVTPERLTLTGTTALYEYDGVRFKAFADKGAVVELREELPDLGMLRIGMPDAEDSFLIWPEAVGRRQSVPFPRGEMVEMTVPGTNTQYYLYLPNSYDPDIPSPLILCLHNSNHQSMLKAMRNICEESGWIGVGRTAFGRGGRPYRQIVERFQALEAVLDDVRRRVPHDRLRTYIVANRPACVGSYEFVRIAWNEFAGIAALGGWMARGHFGGELAHPERMAIAQCQGHRNAGALQWSLGEALTAIRCGSRCRNFVFEGGTGMPPPETIADIMQWFEDDWRENGRRLSVEPREETIARRAREAWTAFGEERYETAANLALELILAAPPSRYARGIEHVFEEIMGDAERSQGWTLQCPEPFRERAWRIMEYKAMRHRLKQGVELGDRHHFAYTQAMFDFLPAGQQPPQADWLGDDYVRRGYALYSARRFDEAALLFERAMVYAPDNATHPVWKGWTHYVMGDYDEALRQYYLALRINPDHVDAIWRIGLIHQARGDFVRAISFYDRAERADRVEKGEAGKPNLSPANARAIALFLQRDFDKAIPAFQACLDAGHFPVNTRLWLHAARLLKGIEDRPDLRAFAEEREADLGKASQAMIALFLGDHTPAQAVGNVDALPDVAPDDKAAVRYWAGLYSLAQGREAEAQVHFEEATAIDDHGYARHSRNELRRIEADRTAHADSIAELPEKGRVPRIALFGAGTQDAANLATLMELVLSHRSDLIMLDRQHASKILAEHAIALDGRLSAAAAANIGVLLDCDMLAELHEAPKLPAGDENTDTETDAASVSTARTLVVFDALTGIRLSDTLLEQVPGDSPEYLAERWAELVMRGVEKWRRQTDFANFATVFLDSSRNVGLPDSMSHVPGVLGELLTRALLSSPHVAVVERERLQYVNLDARIASDRRDRLLATSLLLDLDVTRGKDANHLAVRAALSDKDGKEMAVAAQEGKASDIGGIAVGLARKIGETTARLTVTLEPDHMERESRRFAARGGRRAEAAALALAEAVLARDPDNSGVALHVTGLLMREASHVSRDLQAAEKRNDPDAARDCADLAMDLVERALMLLERQERIPTAARRHDTTMSLWDMISNIGTLRSRIDILSAGQRDRLDNLRNRCFEMYKQRCRAGRAQYDVARFYAIAPSRDEAIEAWTELFPRTVWDRVQSSDYLNYWSARALLEGRPVSRNSLDRHANTKPLSDGLSASTLRKLLAFYEGFADLIGYADLKLEQHVCAMHLVQRRPDAFENADEIMERNLRAAADVVIRVPSASGEFAHLLLHGQFPDHHGVAENRGSLVFPNQPSTSPLFPLETVLPEIRRLVEESKNRIGVPLDMYSMLDWYDRDHADYPGYYLDEAVRQMMARKIENQSLWDRLDSLYKVRYGQANRTRELRLHPPAPAKQPERSFAFRDEKLLYAMPGDMSAILSVRLIGRRLHLLTGHDFPWPRNLLPHRDAKRQAKLYKMIELDLDTKQARALARFDAAQWAKRNDTSLPIVTGRMQMDDTHFHIPLNQGLLSISRKTGAQRVLDGSVLPSPLVHVCLPMGDRLYLACGDGRASYLVHCRPDGSDLKLAAASVRREQRSELDNSKPYIVENMLYDKERDRVLLSAGETSEHGLFPSEHGFFRHGARLYGWSLKDDAIERIRPAGQTLSRWSEQQLRLSIRDLEDGTFLLAYSHKLAGSSRLPDTGYLRWDPATDQTETLVARSGRAQFTYSIAGRADAMAWTGNHAFLSPLGLGASYSPVQGFWTDNENQWAVLERSGNRTVHANLPLPDDRAPFFLRLFDGKLLAVTRGGVRLYEYEGVGIETELPPEVVRDDTPKKKAVVRDDTAKIEALARQGPDPSSVAAEGEPSARLTVASVEEGTVVLNGGRPIGVIPGRPAVWPRLRPGKHTVVVTCWGVEWTRTFDLKPGQTLELKAFTDP